MRAAGRRHLGLFIGGFYRVIVHFTERFVGERRVECPNMAVVEAGVKKDMFCNKDAKGSFAKGMSTIGVLVPLCARASFCVVQ